jgi:hypothetical protein
MATPKHTPDSPELSVISADGETGSSELAAPFFELEVCRGKTVYPTRPVCSRNFLIGSGPSCDLRLGGDDVPLAHTVLIVTEDDVFAQWLCESPPLLVNGKTVHETTLGDGDRIGIGRFEFIVHRILTIASVEEAPAPTDVHSPATSDMVTSDLLGLLAQARAEEPAEVLAELSASDLLDVLETEQNAVDRFQDAVQQAEAALLYAAAQHAENLVDGSMELDQTSAEPRNSHESVDSATENPEILDELERVIQQLSGFSSELELRARRIAAEEANQAEAAEMLLDAQKELASQLERFHKQMSTGQEHAEPKLRKAA